MRQRQRRHLLEFSRSTMMGMLAFLYLNLKTEANAVDSPVCRFKVTCQM